MSQPVMLRPDPFQRKLLFDELFRANWTLLFQISLKKTGVEQDAYDIVQELFIEIWENDGDLLTKCNDRAFLVSVLYNKIFLYFRRKGVQMRHYEDFRKFVMLKEPVAQTDGELDEEEAAQQSIWRIIREEIAHMPEKMREIFVLSSFEGHTIEEIADKLSLSRQTVKNQLSHARKRLRALFFFL
jgi:RNA polymerase sigma-70 factor (ECF subfamily)